jgi:hypothetical protein
MVNFHVNLGRFFNVPLIWVHVNWRVIILTLKGCKSKIAFSSENLKLLHKVKLIWSKHCWKKALLSSCLSSNPNLARLKTDLHKRWGRLFQCCFLHSYAANFAEIRAEKSLCKTQLGFKCRNRCRELLINQQPIRLCISVLSFNVPLDVKHEKSRKFILYFKVLTHCIVKQAKQTKFITTDACCVFMKIILEYLQNDFFIDTQTGLHYTPQF